MENEPLARHTVFKIGGPARFFVEAESAEDFIAALKAAFTNNISWLILGAGSNILASDKGFDGVVIRWSGGEVKVNGSKMEIEAPVAMARAASESIKAGLAGFEWAVGIPGTVGGSVRGNAGCFGGEMKDVVESIKILDMSGGGIREMTAGEAAFAYRESIFKKRPELVVISATLNLKPGDANEGIKLLRQYTLRRSETQDIGSQSAGCIFKNVLWSRRDVNREKLLNRFPELAEFSGSPGISTGFLIDRAGLKGRTAGGAKISERHGNFFLNTGGASAGDVITLIAMAKQYVERKFGILLEEEIQYIGF